MGTIHQLPTAADAHLRLMQKLVADMISQHPDPDIAQRWSEMAMETLSRYPGPPMPTSPLLDLDSVDSLTSEQANAIHALTQGWLQGYFEDVREQLMQCHKDMLQLQRRVAELESGV